MAKFKIGDKVIWNKVGRYRNDTLYGYPEVVGAVGVVRDICCCPYVDFEDYSNPIQPHGCISVDEDNLTLIEEN